MQTKQQKIEELSAEIDGFLERETFLLDQLERECEAHDTTVREHRAADDELARKLKIIKTQTEALIEQSEDRGAQNRWLLQTLAAIATYGGSKAEVPTGIALAALSELGDPA